MSYLDTYYQAYINEGLEVNAIGRLFNTLDLIGATIETKAAMCLINIPEHKLLDYSLAVRPVIKQFQFLALPPKTLSNLS